MGDHLCVQRSAFAPCFVRPWYRLLLLSFNLFVCFVLFVFVFSTRFNAVVSWQYLKLHAHFFSLAYILFYVKWQIFITHSLHMPRLSHCCQSIRLFLLNVNAKTPQVFVKFSITNQGNNIRQRYQPLVTPNTSQNFSI